MCSCVRENCSYNLNKKTNRLRPTGCSQTHTHVHKSRGHTLTQKHTLLTQVSERTGHQSNKPEVAVLRAWIYFPKDFILTAGQTITHCASFHTRRNVIVKNISCCAGHLKYSRYSKHLLKLYPFYLCPSKLLICCPCCKSV